MKRKLDQVIDYVCENARYMGDSQNMPYFVRYPTPHSANFICAKDTRELVLKIMNQFHPRCKMENY